MPAAALLVVADWPLRLTKRLAAFKGTKFGMHPYHKMEWRERGGERETEILRESRRSAVF